MSLMQTRIDRLTQILTTQFTPLRLDIVDQSALHAGHAGAAAGGETHYHVTLVTAQFAGLTRVARSRCVNQALADEFAGGLHALSLTLRAPDEDAPG